MNQADRPILGLAHDDGPVIAFVEGLQEGIDAADADRFNASFADDVLWGTPFGAVVDGYDTLHLIHTRMFAALPRGVGSRYAVEHIRFPMDGVAVAFVRRTSTGAKGQVEPGRPDSFDELAMFVLVQRDGAWWLAAGQHTPDHREVYAASAAPSAPFRRR